ncbi:MAG TPA: FG-GAP-like repeat-containing protein, partial [Terracidiphilus sp.]
MFVFSPVTRTRVLLTAVLIAATSLMASQAVLAAALPASTTTQLAITSGGQAVSSGGTVASGSVITLTATVMAGTTAVTPGQVNFCDASATYCTDIHLLGTAFVNSSGAATFKFVPGSGTHSYKAEFVGNNFGLSSSSSDQSLTVGPSPAVAYSDTTAISETGQPGNYSLTATVTGYGGSEPPTGNVSFLDTSYGNALLGTTPLGTSTAGIGWQFAQTPTVSGTPIAEVAGDFNGDGIPDLAILWNSGTYGGPYSVTILFGKGDGTFTAGSTTSLALPIEINVSKMIVGDFNGDGKTDLAILNWNQYSTSYITSLLGNGDGTFEAPKTSTAYNQAIIGGDVVPGSMVTADFNGDGKLDLAIVGDYINSGGITILLGNGDGTFTSAGPNIDLNASFDFIATGDFNGDGIPDLIATVDTGATATILLGKGDGTFTAQTMPMTLSYGSDEFINSLAVGDFNGDGKLDLAFSGFYGAAIFLGNGDGTFSLTSDSPIEVPSELSSLVVGDFNHDGKLDIAGIDNPNGFAGVVVLEGAGDGTFAVTSTAISTAQNSMSPFQIIAADFNGDGVPDLAMLTNNANTASLLLNQPVQTASATLTSIAPIGAGTHNVEASYAGDSNYPLSTSSTVALTAGVAVPVITPANGVYTTAQTVTITDSTPGATIYYAAEGIVNTSGYVVYTGPITLSMSGEETIYAYATATGYQQSQSVLSEITVNLPLAAEPVISLASGTYSSAQTVTITDTTPGATIYYTTDGSTPTINSPQYSGAITISSTAPLVASASAPGYSMSADAFAQYFITGSSNSYIYTVAGNETAGYSGDGGPATSADLNFPFGTVLDSAGNLYIADTNNNVIRKVAVGTGIITTIAGTEVGGYSGDNGPATSAQLWSPRGIALDSNGNLYIADTNNSVVRMVSAATGVITTVAGNGTNVYSGDNGQATNAGIVFPLGVALDAAGNLFIVTVDDRVRKVAAGTGTITTFAGNGGFGYNGDNGPAINATLFGSQGIALDGAGNLYIADTNNNIIREVNAKSGIITTVAGTPPTTQFGGSSIGGYSGDGGPATSAKLNIPVGIAIDGAGNLYIVDAQNDVIRKVTASIGIITTVAGKYPPYNFSWGGDGDSATEAHFYNPSSV